VARKHSKEDQTLGIPSEEGGKMSANNLRALSLFGGADKFRDKVLDKATVDVRAKLKKYTYMDLRDLEKNTGLEKYTLILEDKENKIDKDIYKSLKVPLRLSIKKDLEENFSTEELQSNHIREYWEKEQKDKPIRLVAAGGLSENIEMPKKPISLEMYVTLRAMGEFYRSL
jgi:hypothetical protein